MPHMEIEFLIALIVAGVFAVMFTALVIHGSIPMIKQAHGISVLKESGGETASAEITEIKTYNFLGLRKIVFHIVNVRFDTERETVYTDIIFMKRPAANLFKGQSLTLIYNPENPTTVMTAENLESEGWLWAVGKLIASVWVGFVLMFCFILAEAFDKD